MGVMQGQGRMYDYPGDLLSSFSRTHAGERPSGCFIEVAWGGLGCCQATHSLPRPISLGSVASREEEVEQSKKRV